MEYATFSDKINLPAFKIWYQRNFNIESANEAHTMIGYKKNHL